MQSFGSQYIGYILLVLVETMSEKSTYIESDMGEKSEEEMSEGSDDSVPDLHENSDSDSDDDSDDPIDHTVEQHTQSNLVTRLLMRATSGTGSYADAQGDAYGAYLDGLRHPEVSVLASCGNWGSVPGNVRRDVGTAFFNDKTLKNFGYAKPAMVEVYVKHPGSC